MELLSYKYVERDTSDSIINKERGTLIGWDVTTVPQNNDHLLPFPVSFLKCFSLM